MNMQNCSHTFFQILGRTAEVIVVCIYCGQIREDSCNGIVTILKEHGEIKRNTAD